MNRHFVQLFSVVALFLAGFAFSVTLEDYKDKFLKDLKEDEVKDYYDQTKATAELRYYISFTMRSLKVDKFEHLSIEQLTNWINQIDECEVKAGVAYDFVLNFDKLLAKYKFSLNDKKEILVDNKVIGKETLANIWKELKIELFSGDVSEKQWLKCAYR